MARRRFKAQRLFWIVSLLVVLSMAAGLVFSFLPRPPRITPTPSDPSPTPFPTRTPTLPPTPG